MNDYWARKITLAVAISFLIDSSTRQTKLAKCCFLYEYTIHKLATFITCHWQLVRNLILHQQAKCSFICLAHLSQIKFSAISMHADSPCYLFFYLAFGMCCRPHISTFSCSHDLFFLLPQILFSLPFPKSMFNWWGRAIVSFLKGSVCSRRKGRESVY